MMRLTRMAATIMIVGGLGFGSVAIGAPVASARPAAPMPEKPGHGNDYCPPWCGNNGNGNGNRGHDDWNNGFNNGHDNWDKGQWWASNRHDWWDDRQGPPPWGWGPPPPFQWNGGPLPQSINYYGYDATPVWNGGQWGIWLFGLWIPIFGVGFN